MNELKPCPFCGDAPKSEECYWQEHQGWHVVCPCWACPICSVSSGDDPCETAKAEAIALWNTRVSVSVPDQSVELPEKWQQGFLIKTRTIERWSQEEQRSGDYEERCQIFRHFTAEDQGRGREFIARCRTPDEAAELVKEHNDLIDMLAKRTSKQESGEEWVIKCLRNMIVSDEDLLKLPRHMIIALGQEHRLPKPEWQPIETAPRDGRWIKFGLIEGRNDGPYQAEIITRYNKDDGYWISSVGGAIARHKKWFPWTHWAELIPLPTPPATKGEG